MGRTGRRRLVGGVAALLLLGSSGLAVARHVRATACGAHVDTVAASSPFLDARGRAAQPDARRDRLVRSAGAWPFGPVLGAAGYDYDQYLHVAGLPGGLAVWTRDNPTMAFLSAGSLRPRWGLRTDTARSAWDVGAGRFLDIALPHGHVPELSAVTLARGDRLWCAPLGDRPVRPDDPLATLVLARGDVAALTPGPPGQVVLSRLAGADGSLRWHRSVRISGGDFLGDLGGGVLVAGGVRAWRLADAGWLARQAEGPSLAGLSAGSGALRWTWQSPAGTAVHVLGTDVSSGLVVLMSWGPAGGRVFALDRSGDQVWSAEPFPGYHLDATLRSGQVLVRADGRLAGYDARSGSREWSVPTPGQFFPYGFEIDAGPSLDARHVLLGGTTALLRLDLETGEMSSYPLPRDGINTTYWPYQVAVTDRLVAVVTNTGAVVLRRGRR